MKTLDERAKEEADLLLDCAEEYESLNICPAQACKLSTLIADQSKALTKANERVDALVEHIADNDPEWEKSTVDRIFKEYRDEQAKQALQDKQETDSE